MKRVVRVVLPYPPSANAYWKAYRGKVQPSEEGKAYKEVVAAALRARLGSPMKGPTRVQVDVFRPRADRDLDNNPKVLKDSLQGFVYENDRQTFRMVFEHWDVGPDLARVQVTVEEDFAPRGPPPLWELNPADEAMVRAGNARMDAVRASVRTKTKERRARKAAQGTPLAKKDARALATPAVRGPRP